MGYAKQEVQQVQHTEQHEDDPAHDLIHSAMSVFGSGTIVIALILGGIVMYKKFAAKWFVK